jgi:hypothetical protein
MKPSAPCENEPVTQVKIKSSQDLKSGFGTQPSYDIVKLIEVAVADVDDAPGLVMIDADGKSERVTHGFFQRHRVGILCLAASRLLRFALRNTFDMGQGFGLPHIEAFLDDAFRGGNGVGNTDERAGMAG